MSKPTTTPPPALHDDDAPAPPVTGAAPAVVEVLRDAVPTGWTPRGSVATTVGGASGPIGRTWRQDDPGGADVVGDLPVRPV